jgi:glutamate receptor, ionotropic, invertebrate
MHEHGLQERENSRLYTKKPRCASGGGKFVSVGLIDVEPALLVIIWGAGLSFFALFLEILSFKLINYVDRKVNWNNKQNAKIGYLH